MPQGGSGSLMWSWLLLSSRPCAHGAAPSLPLPLVGAAGAVGAAALLLPAEGRGELLRYVGGAGQPVRKQTFEDCYDQVRKTPS